MSSITDLVELIQDVLAFPISGEDIETNFDQLEGWDSVYTLRLISSIETQIGRKLPVSAFLQASSIQEVYNLIA